MRSLGPKAAGWRAAASASALIRGGRQPQPASKHMGRVPGPQPARTRLLTGPVVAAPGEWREGWDVTFLRPSQVHVIVARRGRWSGLGPDGLVPMGPKGSKRAPGGTAPGGSRFGRPEDGSISALGKPDLRGSTIMPPLRHPKGSRSSPPTANGPRGSHQGGWRLV